jgi:Cof subfamily protein (haloacid dehalogenase superfamily)
MKKFEGMLFCTDLDGTLLSSDKTISARNRQAIDYFKSEGGLFTFITGRVPKTSNKIYEMVNPNAPYGCINGGGIYDPVQNKFLWKTILPREALELVADVDRLLPEIGIQLNAEENIYFNKDNGAMVKFRQATGVPKITCHYNDVTEPILKVVFGHDEEKQIEMLAEFLNNHPKALNYDFIRSERKLYEILPKGVSKGTLLCKMADILGISPDKTIAIGDYNNDVSMIKAAKLGVAVSNAVEEAKAAADYITVSNNEDAIWHVVDLLDRGELVL